MLNNHAEQISEQKVQAARKPNFVLSDHSSRPAITDRLQQPTRKFRLPLARTSSQPKRDGPSRADAWERRSGSLPIWSCSVWGLPCRLHYCKRGGLLPHPFTLTAACAEAVCFLLHWPYLLFEKQAPDVIRHTALRSSDFPPPLDTYCYAREAAIARPPACSIVEHRLRVWRRSSP